MNYSIITIEGQESLTVLVDGVLRAATSSHPAYDEIKARVLSGDTSVSELFDVRGAINDAFGEVTDRVTVHEDEVLLDGKPVNGSVSRVLIALVGQGDRDGFIGLARFLERLDDNPSHRSREQLYNFVENNEISIDKDGNLVLYKGVRWDEADGCYTSQSQGRAFVNGVEYNGYIPARIGDTVTMPRSEISDDPNRACHAGLHAGAKAYADGFAASATLRVLVGPEHVVSVPSDSSFMKIRTERYVIGDIVTKEMPVYWSGGLVEEDDEEYYDDYKVDEVPSVWPFNVARSNVSVQGHSPYWN